MASANGVAGKKRPATSSQDALAALRVLERPGPEVGREPGGRPVISWGAHLHSPVLRALSHHPRICAPAKQLLGGGPGGAGAVTARVAETTAADAASVFRRVGSLRKTV